MVRKSSLTKSYTYNTRTISLLIFCMSNTRLWRSQDGTSWCSLINIMTRSGFDSTAIQNLMRTLEGKVTKTCEKRTTTTTQKIVEKRPGAKRRFVKFALLILLSNIYILLCMTIFDTLTHMAMGVSLMTLSPS